jgi:arylsulfatase
LRPGTRRSPNSHDLGYTTGEFGKNHLATTAAPLTAHGFQEYWVTPSPRRDAAGELPDINKSPTEQTVAPQAKHADPACRKSPAPSTPNHNAPTPLRPVLGATLHDGEEPIVQERGPRRWTVADGGRGNLGYV